MTIPKEGPSSGWVPDTSPKSHAVATLRIQQQRSLAELEQKKRAPQLFETHEPLKVKTDTKSLSIGQRVRNLIARLGHR